MSWFHPFWYFKQSWDFEIVGTSTLAGFWVFGNSVVDIMGGYLYKSAYANEMIEPPSSEDPAGAENVYTKLLTYFSLISLNIGMFIFYSNKY